MRFLRRRGGVAGTNGDPQSGQKEMEAVAARYPHAEHIAEPSDWERLTFMLSDSILLIDYFRLTQDDGQHKETVRSTEGIRIPTDSKARAGRQHRGKIHTFRFPAEDC